jgi:NAD(P)H-dependent FMN reductase
MRMKAIGIVGSYRKGGVIDTAIDEVLQGAASTGAEVEKVFLGDHHFEYCRNCRTCAQEPGDEPGHCVIADGMADLIARCRTADVLVVGSPVNIGTATAVTKAFLERLAPNAYWPWGSFAPKVRRVRGAPRPRAVLVASCGAPALLGKWTFGAMGTLRAIASSLNATVVEEQWLGLMARRRDQTPTARQRARLRTAGRRAATRPAIDLPAIVGVLRDRVVDGVRSVAALT